MSQRLMIAAGCLALGLAAQLGLRWHLDRFGSPYPDIQGELSSFPSELPDGWKGQDYPDLAEFRAKLPYDSDAILWRRYQNAAGDTAVNLYAVFSRQGEDRNHHPEICMREAAGVPEDRSGRAIVYLDGDARRPVQRFRFRTGADQAVTVYYWHYTFEPAWRDRPSFLQGLYQNYSRRAPSMTVQASVHGSEQEQETTEKDFLGRVDSALRAAYLPPSARMSCERLPILLLNQ
jgi:hypothetical protein